MSQHRCPPSPRLALFHQFPRLFHLISFTLFLLPAPCNWLTTHCSARLIPCSQNEVRSTISRRRRRPFRTAGLRSSISGGNLVGKARFRQLNHKHQHGQYPSKQQQRSQRLQRQPSRKLQEGNEQFVSCIRLSSVTSDSLTCSIRSPFKFAVTAEIRK